MQQHSAQQKIISVSGLHSGIGKTSLCEHLISLLPGIAAIKVTINDLVTEVLDDEASIMVAGKDTWRLKTSGASRVVWVRAQEERLSEALAEARKKIGTAGLLLMEGNSMLAHINPALAFFVCDERICADAPLKPSRILALSRADVVIINLRAGGAADTAGIRDRIRHINPIAAVYALNLLDKNQVAPLIHDFLQSHGILLAS